MNIDYGLLEEQYEFLCLLQDDLRNGTIVLPSKYEELGALPTEYLDGLFGLIGSVSDTNKCVHATCYEDPDFENLRCMTCGVRVEPQD